jgi:hypothetical protein
VVDMNWKENRLVAAKIYSKCGVPARVNYKGKSIEITNLKKGESKELYFEMFEK